MQAQLWAMLTFLAICLAAAPRSHADTRPTQGVVAVGGNADERDRAVVGASIEAATRVAGWQLPDKPLTKKESAGLLRCLAPGEPWKCIPPTIDAKGIRHALVVAAERRQGEDGSPMVVLTAKLIVTRPHALIVRQRFCEHCTDDKLTAASSELTEQLVRELGVRIGRTVLVIKSSPTGARIVLDGEPIGATDATFNTYPGRHLVVIEKPGFLTQTIPIEAEEGKTAEVSAMLQASSSGTTSPTRDKPRPSRIVPVVLLGAGSASLATAGVMFYLGEQDGPDDKYLHTRATTVGIVTGVVGVAAVGTGVYLWMRGSKASGSKASAPTASPVPGGAVVGWAGTF